RTSQSLHGNSDATSSLKAGGEFTIGESPTSSRGPLVATGDRAATEEVIDDRGLVVTEEPSRSPRVISLQKGRFGHRGSRCGDKGAAVGCRRQLVDIIDSIRSSLVPHIMILPYCYWSDMGVAELEIRGESKFRRAYRDRGSKLPSSEYLFVMEGLAVVVVVVVEGLAVVVVAVVEGLAVVAVVVVKGPAVVVVVVVVERLALVVVLERAATHFYGSISEGGVYRLEGARITRSSPDYGSPDQTME
ncbi:hypothetical protein FOZ63_033191, partial [Perkinsus olseni]